MTELKPCPFCGEAYLEIKASRIAHGIDFIRCEVCGAKVEYDHGRSDDPGLDSIIGTLIERWNRRESR